MPDAVKKEFNLEKFLKRSWPYIVAGAVFVLLVAGLIFRLVITGKTRGEQNAQTPTGDLNVPTSTVEEIVPRHLDGVPVPLGQEGLQPYAVMIENSPDARPLSGISRANLVIEAPVEGGITRFMAVFDATTTVEQIGPVRSARLYFVELADALKAVYTHVGGSPEALQKIGSISGFRNLDEFYNGAYFWRSAKRAAPHNVYTSTDQLHTVVAKKEWEAASFTPWRYLSETASSTEPGDITTVSISYGGTFNAAWSYDAEANRYIRRQAGYTQKDSDGTVVSSTNILILRTDQQVLDEYGRLRVRTTGSGRGFLYRDGHRFEVTWHRSAGSWLTFESIEGGDVFFEPGPTWISFATMDDEFPTVPTTTSTNAVE